MTKSEATITPRQSRELGEMGQALSIMLGELAKEWLTKEGMTDDRSQIAAVLTVLEATAFLTVSKLLEPEERAAAVRTMSISLRQSLSRYHKDTGQ